MSEATKTKPERKKVADPELLAMNAIVGKLAGLDENAQHRVLNWLNDKYGAEYEPAAPKE